MRQYVIEIIRLLKEREIGFFFSVCTRVIFATFVRSRCPNKLILFSFPICARGHERGEHIISAFSSYPWLKLCVHVPRTFPSSKAM